MREILIPILIIIKRRSNPLLLDLNNEYRVMVIVASCPYREKIMHALLFNILIDRKKTKK